MKTFLKGVVISVSVLVIGSIGMSYAYKGSPEDFESVAKLTFSTSVVKSMEYQDGTGVIIFKVNDDYFGTGDKSNKICAIESARLFTWVPELKILKIAIPLSRNTRSYKCGIHTLVISRSRIEKFYGMTFTKKLHENNHEPWRQKFIRKYDNKKVRAIFAKNFVKIANL